jgi:hypothetical protein
MNLAGCTLSSDIDIQGKTFKGRLLVFREDRTYRCRTKKKRIIFTKMAISGGGFFRQTRLLTLYFARLTPGSGSTKMELSPVANFQMKLLLIIYHAGQMQGSISTKTAV